MAYTFEQIFAADPSNPANIARNATILIFAPGDGAKTPLTLTTPADDALANPVPVNNNGFGSAFVHDTLDRVAWEGGGFTGFFTSYEGMKEEAVAARDAAQTAQTAAEVAGADAAAVAEAALAGAVADAEAAQAAAETAAGLVGAPADAAVETLINTPASATAAALTATILDQTEPLFATKLESAARGTLGGRIVYMGDSITKGAPTNTSILLGESYPLYASLLSGQQLYMAANSGVGGETTAQILARMDADVWAYDPQTVVITAGTNDYLQSVPFATFKANFAALIDDVQEHNAGCVVATMPPHNTSSWHATISLWNAWIKQYAASRGVFVLDFNALLTDPATGGYITAMGGEDTIHPNSTGYQAMGQLAVTQLLPKLAPAYVPLSIKNNDANNLFANGLMLTDTNADGIPDGWSASGGSGYTHSLVTVAGVPGKMWRTDMAAGATARNFNSVTLGTGKISAGETILFAGRVGAVAGTSVKLFLQFLDGGGAGLTRLTPMDTLTRSISDGGVFLLQGVAPANVANAQVYGTIGASANGGRVDIGQITILNLTRLGLA